MASTEGLQVTTDSDRPVSERTRLIREQQRSGTGEVTAVMVSPDTGWGGVDGYDVFTWWKRAQSPLDAVVADLRKHGVTDPNAILRALRPVVEWVVGDGR